MYYANELALKLAEALDLPKNLIWYNLRFSYDSEPRVRCEFELHEEDGSIKVEDGEILTAVKEFKIHAEEIVKE